MKKLGLHAFASALGALLCAGSIGSAHASAIVNGNFESGDFSGWSFAGTTFVGASSDPGFAACCAAFNTMSPANGTYQAFLGYTNDSSSPGTFAQTFSTVAGLTYVLTFDFGAFGGNEQQITFALTNSSLASVDVLDVTPTSDLSQVMSPHGFTFTATGASSTLSFTDTSPIPDNSLLLLDNVSVEMPIPGTLALLVFGLAGLGAGARRRK